MTASVSLKDKVLKGGVYLTLRQLLASGFSLVSTLVIARLLGPESYGIVSATLGIFYFLRWTSRMGLGAYLIREPDITEADAEQVLAFYNTCGVLFCVLLWLLAPAFGWWIGRSEITYLLRLLVPAIWLDMVSNVSLSQLNRRLRFDKISLVEAVAQTANYLLAIPLVLLYESYWGPIAGTLLQFVLLAGLSCWFYPVRWRMKWQWMTLSPALRFGISFYCATWLFNLRNLTIPLFVSRLAGIEAVGIANIAVRMVRQLMLLRNVLKRMSMSIMAKLMDDATATRRAISRGMAYQALLIGSICALFASVASWLVPTVFGPEWLPSARLVPLVGISTLIGSVFDLHSATLYAAGKIRSVILMNLGYVAILWIASLSLIPGLGVWGYGIAEILATPAYLTTHRVLTQIYGSPDYQLTSWLILASAVPALAGIWLPTWANLLLLVVSYGAVFAVNSSARNIVVEIKAVMQSRKANPQKA
ncbi:MAG: oligosaccharide flippase family protein [Cyanobacteria bacterium J06648_16]